MSGLDTAVVDYLAARRALGFKLERHGRLLPQLVGHLQQAGAATLTTRLALAWATSLEGHPDEWPIRLSIARGFARWLQAVDPATEVPPADLLPRRGHRASPYRYAEADIAALLAATETLRFPLRRATYRTLIGLLAVTGMRVGEAIGLDRDDLDQTAGCLVVRKGKPGAPRELPLHQTTIDALAAYASLRDRHWPCPKAPAFFLSTAGTRLFYENINRTFRRLVRQAGLPARGSCRPRMLSRSGARFRCCHRSVSPDRSPNPPYRSLGNGLSTVSAVRRGSWSARGLGSCCPGRCNGRPSPSRSGRTRSRPP